MTSSFTKGCKGISAVLYQVAVQDGPFFFFFVFLSFFSGFFFWAAACVERARQSRFVAACTPSRPFCFLLLAQPPTPKLRK